VDDLKLRNWAESNASRIAAKGYRVDAIAHGQGQESLNMDNALFVGTVTLWPSGECEVQFNSATSGDVLFLVPSVELDDLMSALDVQGVI